MSIVMWSSGLLLAWATLNFLLMPALESSWRAGSMSEKMARAGSLVALEKLRDLSLAGGVSLAIVALLVLVALATNLGAVLPKQAIDAAASGYEALNEFADAWGETLAVWGAMAAAVSLWLAGRSAKRKVAAAWAKRAQAAAEEIQRRPELLVHMGKRSEFAKLLKEFHERVAAVGAAEGRGALEPELIALRASVGEALSALAIERARGEVDAFGSLQQAPEAGSAGGWRRWARLLRSAKLMEDVGLVHRALGWGVMSLLFVSLLGWAAVPLANDARLVLNNLTVNFDQAQAVRAMDQALSRRLEPEAPDVQPPTAETQSAVTRAAQLAARGAVRGMLRSGLGPNAVAHMDAGSLHRAEYIRAALAQHQLPLEAGADDVQRVRSAFAEELAKGHIPEPASVQRLQRELEAPLQTLQREQPGRFRRWLSQLEARYALPVQPLQAQEKLLAQVLDRAFGAAPEAGGEMAVQAQKLLKDFGNESVKAWADARVKGLVASSLQALAVDEVREAMPLRASAEMDDFMQRLRQGAGTGWAGAGIGAAEAQVGEEVARAAARLHPEGVERRVAYERLGGGYDRLFALEAAEAPPMGGGGGGGGVGGGQKSAGRAGPSNAPARATSVKLASRSFRVRGVLIGEDAVGQPLDVRDLRWVLTPSAGGQPAKVTISGLLHRAGAMPAWVNLGDYPAGVVNQALRYAADRRVVATTITAGDGEAIARMTQLHPALVDTPLGCRVIEADRWVDTFTLDDERPPTVAITVGRDRVQTFAWLARMRLAEAVVMNDADICPQSRIDEAVRRSKLPPVSFSPSLDQALRQFIEARAKPSPGHANFLKRAQRCNAVPDSALGACLCRELGGRDKPRGDYWFPEDHTSQVRERAPRLDAQGTWLVPSADRLGHLDFWTHITFSLRDGSSGESNEDKLEALDFPATHLQALRKEVELRLDAHLARLHMSREAFLKPMEEFILAQRLFRAALSSGLGDHFPLAKLLQLERETRAHVARQPTLRWEPMLGKAAVLREASGEAARLYEAQLEDDLRRRATSSPICGPASL